MLQKLLDEIKEEIRRKVRTYKNAKKMPINEISEAFPSGTWDIDFVGRVSFNLPYSQQLINAFRESMPDFGVKIEREASYIWEKEKSAGYFFTLRANGVVFETNFRSHREGSTCVLNKIGEKVETIPIYEVVCSQEAADEFP